MKVFKLILAAFAGLLAIAVLNYWIAGWYEVRFADVPIDNAQRQVFSFFWVAFSVFEVAVWIALFSISAADLTFKK